MRICLLSLRYLTNGPRNFKALFRYTGSILQDDLDMGARSLGRAGSSGPRSTGSIYPRSSRDLGGKKAKSPLSLRSSRLMPGTSPIASLSPRDDSLRAIALGPSFHATA